MSWTEEESFATFLLQKFQEQESLGAQIVLKLTQRSKESLKVLPQLESLYWWFQLDKKVFKSELLTLLLIIDEWRNAQNIWRLDPLLNIKYVPTLVEMGENGEFLKRKLIEAEIWEQESSII